MSTMQFDCSFDQPIVRSIQVQLAINLHPLHFGRIISCLQLEPAHFVTLFIMKIESNRFHPRIIRVPRIIHIALINLDSIVLKKLINLLFHLLSRTLIFHAECIHGLLSEFPLQSTRNLLARIHHSAWYRPSASVRSLNRDKLQYRFLRRFIFDNLIRRIIVLSHPPSDNGIGSMIRSPSPQPTASSQSSATQWVQWQVEVACIQCIRSNM
mmetsp:Transcript_36064/g.57951  ORF Transcript_36064/g.57951 Transcript_36064/m.57951 type:complete len:211 (+) Transcript_36064:131-763(+)